MPIMKAIHIAKRILYVKQNVECMFVNMKPRMTTKKIQNGGVLHFQHHDMDLHFILWCWSNILDADILQEVILSYAKHEISLKWVFRQDNDSKHTD